MIGEAHTDRDAKTARNLAFVAGFFVTANFSIAPSLEYAPRLLDLFGVGLASASLSKMLFHPYYRRTLWLFGGLWILISYGLWGIVMRDTPFVIASARLAVFSLALPTMSEILRRPGALPAFLFGGAIGALLVAAIAVGQKLDLAPVFFSFVPVGTPTWWSSGELIRAVGIFQHPNGLSQVLTIGATMAATLIWLPRRQLLGYGLFAAIVGANYFATSTRAGIVGAGVALVVVIGLHPDRRYRLFSFLAGWPLFVMAIILGPHLLGDRWTGVSENGMSLFDNVSERLATNLNTFVAMLDHPLGLGVAGRTDLLRDINNGITASHNSYLSFGLTFGLLPFLLLVGVVLLRATRRSADLLYPVSVVIAVQLLAEDSIYSPSVQFPFLVGLFGATAFLERVASDGKSVGPA